MSEYTAVFPVGKRTCRVSATVRTTTAVNASNGMVVTWNPDSPGVLNPTEQAQYINGVGNFLASLSNAMVPLSLVVPQ